MKTTALRTWTAVGLSALMAAAAAMAWADETSSAANPGKSCTGRVASVDPAGQVVTVKGLLWSKRFHLSKDCTYRFVDQHADSLEGLRPGQKVTVHYQDAEGVLVATRLAQQPMHAVGTVKAIDSEKQVLTVGHGLGGKTFQIANDCKVVLHDDKAGTLADVRPGERITVTYETPDGRPIARRIAQTSASFSGQLTALDLSERTVKAKTFSGTRRFVLADGCTIVANGRIDAHMRDLAPGETVTISYNEINGVNVATRVAVAPTAGEALTAQSGR